MKPPVIVCDRCDTLAYHWRPVGDRWLCESCIRAVDDHTRWCACGLLLAGSTRQILAMCEVHWRTCGTWQLLTYDPRLAAVSGLGISPSQRTIEAQQSGPEAVRQHRDPLGLATSTN